MKVQQQMYCACIFSVSSTDPKKLGRLKRVAVDELRLRHTYKEAIYVTFYNSSY